MVVGRLSQFLHFFRRQRRRLSLSIGRMSLAWRSHAGAPLRIVVGSAGENSPGWIPTDAGFLNLLEPSDWKRWNLSGNVSAILAEHVWEHLTFEDGLQAARQCFRALRAGGHLRLAVPDGFFPDDSYILHVRPGGQGPGAHDHKMLYDYRSLQKMLGDAGFEVELLEWWDEKGCFHAKEWNNRQGMVRRSSKHDQRNSDGFLRYTSLIADARKPLSRVQC